MEEAVEFPRRRFNPCSAGLALETLAGAARDGSERLVSILVLLD